MNTRPLPPGVTRSSDILANVTLDNCQAIMLWFGELRCRVVWKGRNTHVRPLTKHRIRELRPGDLVAVDGRTSRPSLYPEVANTLMPTGQDFQWSIDDHGGCEFSRS